jgi:hypothetical protein
MNQKLVFCMLNMASRGAIYYLLTTVDGKDYLRGNHNCMHNTRGLQRI